MFMYTNIYICCIYTVVYSLIICVHSVDKLCLCSYRRQDVMTVSVHMCSLISLEIALN